MPSLTQLEGCSASWLRFCSSAAFFVGNLMSIPDAYAYVYVNIDVYVYANIDAYVCVNIDAYVCVNIDVYVYVNVDAY